MENHIALKNGTIIASFTNEEDRDICIDVLAEYYEDIKFDAIED